MAELPINQIVQGDCIDLMRQWPDESVQCCVTSPPYWGLRDYGVNGQIGLEKTPEEYIAKMVEVFAEVKRLLRKDGTLWLNLGDSYCGSGRASGIDFESEEWKNCKQATNKGSRVPPSIIPQGLKPKDLCGIPWSVAFALQSDGWYLRQDIIWHKPNPMPESVTDRCTKAHEYIFLLSKSGRYYFDNEAIKEDSNCGGEYRNFNDPKKSARNVDGKLGSGNENPNAPPWQVPNNRNRRSVWTVSTHPYKEAHFATFPPKLIEPCIKAGCPKDGIVLDPFMGSGTTAMVAYELNRNYVGCELNPKYLTFNRAEKAKEKYALLEVRNG